MILVKPGVLRQKRSERSSQFRKVGAFEGLKQLGFLELYSRLGQGGLVGPSNSTLGSSTRPYRLEYMKKVTRAAVWDANKYCVFLLLHFRRWDGGGSHFRGVGGAGASGLTENQGFVAGPILEGWAPE